MRLYGCCLIANRCLEVTEIMRLKAIGPDFENAMSAAKETGYWSIGAPRTCSSLFVLGRTMKSSNRFR